MKDARGKVLGKIRSSLQGDPEPPELTRPEAPRLKVADPAQAMREAVQALGGTWAEADGPEDALKAVQGIVAKREGRLVLVSEHPLVGEVLAAGALGTPAIFSREAEEPGELEKADIGLSAATWAAASTGTLIFSSDDERTRAASLTPEASIVLLPSAGLLPGLEDFFNKRADQTSRNSALTLVSGPSRTGDIELTLSTGVHGPGALDVILCGFGGGTKRGG